MTNINIQKRNRIVEDHLWCIDAVMKENAALIKAAHLDRDDVYQQLSLRLIRAVEGFDPRKGILAQHIFAQLKYELLNCKSAYRTTGITGAPAHFRGSNVISFEAAKEQYEMRQALTAA
ncbi:MAG: hypothetical protein HFF06_01645 [Oscillospiraceae bacterium]|jgi:hypothetical protein|nr:hypothetical protein [Oscillospiraceae bacterium]